MSKILPILLFLATPAVSYVSPTPADTAAVEEWTSNTRDEKWSGTATCQVVCTNKNGERVCRFVSANCSLAASYNDARRQLEASINAQVSAMGGQISGSISFSIKKRF